MVLIACGIIAAFGFLQFVDYVDGQSYARQKADGIVVLTGEPSRVRMGVELLEQKLGQRLLISGVSRESQPNYLLTLRENKPSLFACCVDLGFEATTTVGNADEATIWAKQHKFRSIIVVTAHYHMPRALVELQREIGDVKLVPVASYAKYNGTLWSNPALFKRYAVEYLKFCVAWGRARLEQIL